MKNDLISRSALLDSFDVRWVTEYDESGCGVDYKAVPVEAIEKAPAVDAEPVRHGRWIEYDRIAWRTGDCHKIDTTIKEECSNCGRCVERYETVAQENYCPSCGAKMMRG